MALSLKKAKDHRETGNWEVRDEAGALVATVYYDAQHMGWHEALAHNTKHYSEDWLGFNKLDMLEKLEKRVRGNPVDMALFTFYPKAADREWLITFLSASGFAPVPLKKAVEFRIPQQWAAKAAAHIEETLELEGREVAFSRSIPA